MLDTLDTLGLRVAACIEALGGGRFYPRFFLLLDQLAVIDQCMVFGVSDDREQARCYLAHNVHNPELGLKLAAQYVDGSYHNDELLGRLARELLESPGQPACELMLRGTLSPVYRKRFFNVPDLAQKFAILARDEQGGEVFYINFYRSGRDGGFSGDEVQRLGQGAALLSALLIRHFREEGRVQNERRLLSASLSEREAQICEMVLQGHTAKTIGRRLGLSEHSVVTYRKRAYRKLGVARKSELISVMQR
ncbi:helix-turn-helix transcriptional regulator [Marinobacterium nitratireducens]|uniref:Helix-turn-helix transcriptional regulator n=1 Tax=Marinobacterium nitratireducens TaxID=518897 RepID=A0A917ZCL1_9GAMM|nr:helix-turn-helix transcriptional regulator [Marinobacterium nitratireducens]GGO79208.1 helix-turn-helix transcriptional regulator [Marinobacterium nitratireducens]